jgi:DNA-binding transcriptional LysR family regulator
VALAWQLLVADALADGRLVAPFGVKAASGLGYYLVTAAAGHDSRKVAAFRRWLRDEIAATLRQFADNDRLAAAQ